MSREALSNLAFEFMRLEHEGNGIDWSGLPRSWGFRKLPPEDRFERVFQILVAENLRSLRARYGDRLEDQLQKVGDWTALQPSPEYRQKPAAAADVIRLCACYDYQACETHDYRRTAAAKMVFMARDFAHWTLYHMTPKTGEWGEALPGFTVQG